ncbi:Inosose dehydratase [compost metagenome]|uniref:Sugar phosphate isomerase/epimerase n=1 Tax=Sphingobacterium paramultivorum TaxID=2886510 RepID=A0A7G5E9L4_9SPHI|nr:MULTISPECIES: sugar phosphate isomerase/epimerase [Sphingobacterium]MBB1647763.1 sugar phosphate isomerase [Sphingobacterium sp. UME9]QMV70689.1 sugar phosphate isomerase/epimerase [Sphingobacterium paramultivorum]WSO14561.1 sugar phosphate isomerase/epimerase [Sphingobacterium paramultivorum]
MKRRTLIGTLVAGCMMLAVSPTFAQQKAAKKEIGLQLYSVREEIGKNPNFDQILQKISALGYTGVEAAGYKDGKLYNLSPQEFKAKVEKAGMKVISSHATKTLSEKELASGDFTESLKWWDECIATHKAAGMKYIVTPWMDVPKTLKDLETQCRYLDAVGAKCRQQGIVYGYHNHSHEFRKVEDKVMYDYMLEHTNPENVFFEMDVYWAVMGQVSPVDYFNKYAGRFKALHIKDHREIGQSGMVGFDAIFNNSKVAGLQYIFVELEETRNDIYTGLQQSIDYLKKASFVKASYLK